MGTPAWAVTSWRVADSFADGCLCRYLETVIDVNFRTDMILHPLIQQSKIHVLMCLPSPNAIVPKVTLYHHALLGHDDSHDRRLWRHHAPGPNPHAHDPPKEKPKASLNLRLETPDYLHPKSR